MSEAHLDDELLIRRAQGGDRSSFDALIAKHSTRAYQYAFRLTRNPEEAADVVAAVVDAYAAEQASAKKITYTTQVFYPADSPLLPSGLLGPVKILRESKE